MFVTRFYKKQGGFTFNDILERILFFYESNTTLEEIEIIMDIILDDYHNNDTLDDKLFIQEPLKQLFGSKGTKYSYSSIFKGVKKKYLLPDPNLSSFFSLETIKQIFLLAFAESRDDLVGGNFKRKFMRQVKKGQLKRRDLLLTTYTKGLRLLYRKECGYVWNFV